MNKLVAYFIKYPIWANVLMFAVLLTGFMSLKNIKTSFFPEVESNIITISVVYPGTSPEEIEESVILPVENKLRGLSGVDRVTSISSENSGFITIEALDNADIDEVYDDVRNAVDQVSPYPSGAEKPVIRIAKFRARSTTIAFYGDADLWALKGIAESFRDELLNKDGVSQVTIKGIPRREIAVMVSEQTLRTYGMSFSEIAAAIKASNLDISGGTVKTDAEHLLIRSYNRKDFAHEIRNIVVRSDPDGNIVTVGDVAQVREQWEDTPNATYFNGERAILVDVEKTIDEDVVLVSQVVNEFLPQFMDRHPEISAQIISDAAVSLKQRIDLLVKNGIFGFILVLLALGIFLNVRLSFWVAVGIPVSFAGMFIIANWWGITINVISLMGMIIVVGILVDDAIVVAESIYQKAEKGLSPLKAAIEGLSEVIAPVFTAVLTTILAFLPFFFFLGPIGSIIYQLALVVIGALIFSLVESIFILPAHLAHSKGLTNAGTISGLRVKFESFYRFLTYKLYGPALSWAIKHNWVILAIAVSFLLITRGLMVGEIVQSSSFPKIPRDDLRLDLTLATGTPERVTDSILVSMENKLWDLNKKLRKEQPGNKDVILSIQRTIGSNNLNDKGGHAGKLDIELLPGEQRKLQYFEIQKMIRKAVGQVPQSQKLSFGGGRWGKAISISLRSSDLDELDRAKEVLKEKLAEYPDLTDITDSDIEGWREIRLKLRPAAYAAGLTLSDVAGQVRQGFFGENVQRYQRGEDEIEVWVRYNEEYRQTIGALENMYIRGRDGAAYPLHTVAEYHIERGRVSISHIDSKREIRVEADLVSPDIAVGPVFNDIKQNVVPELLSLTENVYVSYEGRQRSNVKFVESLRRAFPPALTGIVVLLILIFRSLWQSGIIVLMIPLGLAGSVWGHMFHGMMLSRLSTFGLVALAGIVINDSIVFIDQINRNLRSGMKVQEAVYLAGISRLRPIILTTVTTAAGMAPLILETSRQAQFLIPMAISLSYGLVFGSMFILFTVPALFLTLNKIRYRIARLYGSSEATHESVEPAVMERETEREIEQ